MPKSLPLLLGQQVTLDAALGSVDDMLLELSYPSKQIALYSHLRKQQSVIEALVSFHLGLSTTERCRMSETREWMCGYYNVCIPIYVDGWIRFPGKRVIIRIPLPYKLGEAENPGNVEEKLRCEAATFIWIKEQCPEVPIPHLWGFGFPNGQCFTTPENVPYRTRLLWNLQRKILSLLDYPVPCRYVSRRYADTLKSGYLIMEYIEGPGLSLLSEHWAGQDQQHDRQRRANFFRDLSHIILNLARVPFPQIGSLVLDHRGIVQLRNRPLNFRLHQLENKGVPTDIDRDKTYSSTEVYFSSLLSCHDNRILHQANSILSQLDGKTQLAVLAAMRALLPHYATRRFRDGPFFFNLIDVHPNNVFVNADWRIKSLIDLEWACIRPIEMLLPPVWVTGKRVDQLPPGEHLNAYHAALEEFFDAFNRVQTSFPPPQNSGISLTTDVMRKGFETGHFWFFHALDNPKVACNLFFQHILPIFAGPTSAKSLDEFKGCLAQLWKRDSKEIIEKKLRDRELYERKLNVMFESNLQRLD
ncbi:MAG: hypothetical protein LQ351_000216 [Letrouitia transgressa]|nr:MAG: hypothetical protein LQ351_000216 [Letrouitia transgressa]